MPEKIGEVGPPRGFSRLLWRAPIWFYRLGFGWMLGGRFLLLNHVGRKSGLPRQAVLEVAGHDAQKDTYTVASGFGANSDWYQNVLKTPDVTIQVGRKQVAVRARPLYPDESGQVMVDYARRNPTAAKSLMRFCGYRVDGSEQDYFIMGHDHIPFVVFEPRQE
jgi:deazaflavin-dependent oxidoreductase (nitroreductase family)